MKLCSTIYIPLVEETCW